MYLASTHANVCRHYYLYYENDDGERSFLALEFNTILLLYLPGKIRTNELCYLPTKTVMESRRKLGSIYVPSKEIEVIHLFFESLFKGKEKYWPRLFDKFEETKNSIMPLLISCFGEDAAGRVFDLLSSGSSESCCQASDELLKAFCSVTRASLGQRLLHDLYAFKERVLGYIKPEGMLVVFLGPDGVGKTYIADRLARILERRFPKIIRTHLGNRPVILPCLTGKRASEVNTNNSESIIAARRSSWRFYQSLRVLYYALDYIVDYFIRLRLWKSKGYLILSERYSYKYFAGPQIHIPKAAKFTRYLACILVPAPDIAIFLDASPQVILRRKKELTEEAIIAQRQAYRGVRKFVREFYVVDNSGQPESVADEIISIILKVASHRSAKKRKLEESLKIDRG
ncbi:MAG: hypothetical protein M0P14_01820 [Alkaliphilus sp.]|nr:hypothetical protein [Alkaliphilus sp.]